MATEKQIEANRRNAQHSTGPKTPAGKARSSMNALKHGLRSSLAVIPGESQEAFDALYDSLRDDLKPTDAFEEILVREIASASWRIMRLHRSEAALYWREMNHCAIFPTRDHPAEWEPYQCENEQEEHWYRQGSALAILVVEENKLGACARYETCARNSMYKALHILETRRRQKKKEAQEQAPEPENYQTKPISHEVTQNQQDTDARSIPAQPARTPDPAPGKRKTA